MPIYNYYKNIIVMLESYWRGPTFEEIMDRDIKKLELYITKSTGNAQKGEQKWYQQLQKT